MPITGEARTASAMGEAPNQPGVYALYENNTLIYVGSAIQGDTTILDRLRAHKSGDKGPCTKWFTHFRCEVTEDEISRQRELLEEFSNRYGSLPRCNHEFP